MKTQKLLNRPPSPKQVEANRANSGKSTGPVTEAGKRNVSDAALKHGLHSRRKVIEALGEKQEDYDALLQSLLEAWHPDDGQQASLVEQVTDYTWLQQRAINSQGQVIEREVVKAEIACRSQDLAQQREELSELDPEIQQWGVRRIPDRPAKFLYWRRLLSVALGLGEVGEWGPQFQMRWRQIYGEYPTPREQYVFWGAHSLGRPRDPKDPDDRPPDPTLPAKLLAELKNDLEEVEREYEIYQRREAQLRAATRGACGVPPDPQFTQAQRTIESMARNIRQTIEQLIKLKRLKAELAGWPGGEAEPAAPLRPPADDPGSIAPEATPHRGTRREAAGPVSESQNEPDNNESHQMLENTGPAPPNRR